MLDFWGQCVLVLLKPNAWRRVFQLRNPKQGKVCLFNHQGLFHSSVNQDTDCLHISACDPNNSLSNNSSFSLLDSPVAGGVWYSPCQRQHQDVTREECGRVNSEPEHLCNMRCTHERLRPSASCYYPVMQRKEQGEVLSCVIPHFFPSPHPAIQRWKEGACWQQRNPVLAKARSAVFKAKACPAHMLLSSLLSGSLILSK